MPIRRGEHVYPEKTVDALVVGAGMAGLTSAAYLCKYGYQVLLCEKRPVVGGLVGTFFHQGYGFDSGIRAFENSGIILPMLRELGIPIDYEKSVVTIGIEDARIRYDREEGLYAYQAMLGEKFPENAAEIARIIHEIEKVIGYMQVIYGIDNPLFVDYKNNRQYVFKTLLPWLLKYTVNIRKAGRLTLPVNTYLSSITSNRSLIDVITQHFFKDTPTFFALSYFGLYLDYFYPKGGTGALAEKMAAYIRDHGGEICTECPITRIDPDKKVVRAQDGRSFRYRQLIWASDMRMLYAQLDLSGFEEDQRRSKIETQKQATMEGRGSDSILSLYLGVGLNKSVFEKHFSAHGFYTPRKIGLSQSMKEGWENAVSRCETTKEKKSVLESWISDYLQATTYELSLPVLSDSSMAPEGKTGLIVSTLMDYGLVKTVSEQGWYDEFKKLVERQIVQILDQTCFPGIRQHIECATCSTPLSLESITGNTEGAITGWSFASAKMPAVNKFTQIAHAIDTPIPDVCQAGQWTFSPSGLPVSILTGKVAADAVNAQLRKRSR